MRWYSKALLACFRGKWRPLATPSIRVLHVYKTATRQSMAGVAVFMDLLCNSTAEYGIKNKVVSLAKKPSEEPISVGKYKVYEAKQNLFIASTGFSISAFALFKKLARRCDVIHYHFPNPFADLLHLLCGVKKPSIVTYHSDVVKQRKLFAIYKPLMNWFLGSVDRIVATSPNYLATSEVLQKFKHKVSVIPIGMDALPKPNKERLRYWRERLPQPFFLFIGMMRYYKGLHIALDAVRGVSNIQLVLAGENIETGMIKQAEQNKLTNIHFVGAISEEDKVALLHLCYGFVLPSMRRSEAFGIALLEAASYGKPLISCEIGTGTSYINIHNETGLVVQPNSSSALAKAMRHLLNNPSKARKFGANAKRRARQIFGSRQQARAYYGLYKHLLNG